MAQPLVYRYLLHMKVFFLCRHPSPYMPFRLIYIQHLSHFLRQSRINVNKPFGAIHMYRRLADAKFFCSLPYRGALTNNIFPNFQRTLFDIVFHLYKPQNACLYSVCGIRLPYHQEIIFLPWLLLTQHSKLLLL